MKVCTKCNRVLADNEAQCPTCAAQERERGIKPYDVASLRAEKEQTTESKTLNDAVIGILDNESSRYSQPQTGESGDRPDDRQKRIFRMEEPREPKNEPKKEKETEPAPAPSISATQVFTIEIPLGEVLEELERKKKAAEVDDDAPEDIGGALEAGKDYKNIEDEDVVAEFSFNRPQTADKETSAPADENAGLIEQELAMRKPEPKPIKKGINKLGVTLVAVLVITVLALSINLITKLVRPAAKSDEEHYLTMLTGTWVSEEFKFTDDDSETGSAEYVELLTIKSDATFTVQYLVVNNSIPNGYLAGEWEVLDEFSGTVEILPDNATLAFLYVLNGEKVAFIRDIIEMDKDEIVLREYYGTDSNNYYDMKLKRAR